MTTGIDPASPPPWRNDPIEPDILPAHADVALRPVAASYRRYATITTLLGWTPVAVAVLGLRWGRLEFTTGWALVGLAAVVVAAAAASCTWRWIEAGFRGWALREHDIIARSGVLWRRTTVLPIARIQHVESSHGPLERAHGLGRLKLFTAGGMTADLVLLGLTRDDADGLRELLVEQIRRRDAAADEPAGA